MHVRESLENACRARTHAQCQVWQSPLSPFLPPLTSLICYPRERDLVLLINCGLWFLFFFLMFLISSMGCKRLCSRFPPSSCTPLPSRPFSFFFLSTPPPPRVLLHTPVVREDDLVRPAPAPAPAPTPELEGGQSQLGAEQQAFFAPDLIAAPASCADSEALCEAAVEAQEQSCTRKKKKMETNRRTKIDENRRLRCTGGGKLEVEMKRCGALGGACAGRFCV